MRRIGYRLLAAMLALVLLGGADLPPALQRGVNITNWFRFPPSRDPAALRGYISDATLADLRRAGFTFVRIPIQSDLLSAAFALKDAIRRVQRHGLAVVVSLFADRQEEASVLGGWRILAPLLLSSDVRLTFSEVLNEPVFAGRPNDWARLQHAALGVIRGYLPRHTVILTGADWGSAAGLQALGPEADTNVIYSVHLYEPAELTALGAYRADLDRAAMARLPFPVVDQAACREVGAETRHAPTAELIRFYCAQLWNAASISTRIAAAAQWGRQHDRAILLGEFGASRQLNAAARLGWLAAVRTACERERVGWALWGYDDVMGFAARPPARQALDGATLSALGLPPNK